MASQNNNEKFSIERGVINASQEFVRTTEFFQGLSNTLQNQNFDFGGFIQILNRTINSIDNYLKDKKGSTAKKRKNIMNNIDTVLKYLNVSIKTSLSLVGNTGLSEKKVFNKDYNIFADPTDSNIGFKHLQSLRDSIKGVRIYAKIEENVNDNIQQLANHLQGLLDSVFNTTADSQVPYNHYILFADRNFDYYKGWIFEGYLTHLLVYHKINLENSLNGEKKFKANNPVLVEEDATEEYPDINESVRNRVDEVLKNHIEPRNASPSYFLNYLVTRSKGQEIGAVGGDIIQIDKNRKVIVNTQAKSFYGQSQDFGVSLEKLNSAFIDLRDVIINNKLSDIMAEDLQDALVNVLETEAIKIT